MRPVSQLDDPAFIKRWGSIYKSYDLDFVWWESVELLRKFLLTGGLVLMPAGSTTQLFLATLVCFFYLCWALNVQPLKDSSDPGTLMTPDRMLQLTNIQIFLIMLMGIMLQTQAPLPGSMEANIFDVLLTLTQGMVTLLGSAAVIAAVLKVQAKATKKVGAGRRVFAKAAGFLGKLNRMRKSRKKKGRAATSTVHPDVDPQPHHIGSGSPAVDSTRSSFEEGEEEEHRMRATRKFTRGEPRRLSV